MLTFAKGDDIIFSFYAQVHPHRKSNSTNPFFSVLVICEETLIFATLVILGEEAFGGLNIALASLIIMA